MTLSQKTLLIISCIPFSLHAMEQNSNTQLIKVDNPNFYPINALYQKTYDTLNKYNHTSPESALALSEIITKTKELKLNNIDEKQVGLFAFKQKPPVFGSGKHPSYISYFFARIATYNTHLEKKNFKSPTPDEFIIFKNNKKIGAAVQMSDKLGVTIDIEKINAEHTLIIDIPSDIAIYQFEQLINDVNEMLHISLETMQTITDMIYEPKKLLNSTKKL